MTAKLADPDSRVPTTTKCELVEALIEHLVEKMTIGQRIEFFNELETHMVAWHGSAEDDLDNYKNPNVIVS